jgi:hypothetical protein
MPPETVGGHPTGSAVVRRLPMGPRPPLTFNLVKCLSTGHARRIADRWYPLVEARRFIGCSP